LNLVLISNQHPSKEEYILLEEMNKDPSVEIIEMQYIPKNHRQGLK